LLVGNSGQGSSRTLFGNMSAIEKVPANRLFLC